RRFHAGRVRQADIEEDVLDRSLRQAQQGDLRRLASLKPQYRLLQRGGDEQQDQSRQGEPPPGENQLTGDVVLGDVQQGVAALHRREGAAPQGAAQGGENEDPGTGLDRKSTRL